MVVAPLFVALTSAGAADATGTSSAGASVVMRAKPTAPAPRTATTMYKSRVLSSGSFEYGNVACMLAHFCTFSHTSLVVCCQWLTLVPLPHSIAWLSTATRQSTLLINDSLMIKVLREVVTCLVNLIL